jgi:hypothetical protein
VHLHSGMEEEIWAETALAYLIRRNGIRPCGKNSQLIRGRPAPEFEVLGLEETLCSALLHGGGDALLRDGAVLAFCPSQFIFAPK